MKMKNKKREQEEKRKAHKECLKVQKRRRRANTTLDRKEPAMEEVDKPKILIVCEGQKTEPSYFNQFRVRSAHITAVGHGYNTESLVQKTYEIVQKALTDGNVYDQVWCVLDKDDHDKFDQAIKLAKQYGFGIAYSNQAFEYWLLLHFNDHQGGLLQRDLCCKKLNEHLKSYGCSYDYKGSKEISVECFELMLATDEKTKKTFQDLAIARAKSNKAFHAETVPSKAESSTTVFELVEILNQYL
jgi:hypothetical protein